MNVTFDGRKVRTAVLAPAATDLQPDYQPTATAVPLTITDGKVVSPPAPKSEAAGHEAPSSGGPEQ
jgi:hypothetical protein